MKQNLLRSFIIGLLALFGVCGVVYAITLTPSELLDLQNNNSIGSGGVLVDSPPANINSNLYPSTDNVYDIGSTALSWRNGVFDGNLTVNGSSTSTFPYGITFATTGGNVGIGTSTPASGLELGLNKKLSLWSTGTDNAGEILVLNNGANNTKAIIAFRDATDGYTKGWIVEHKYASDGVTLHQHLSLETSDTNHALQTRLGIPWDCDFQCNMQINQSDLTITNNGTSDNGRLFLENDVFHTGNFQFFPTGGYSSSTINNRTNGFKIGIANTTTATTTVISAVGGDTKLYSASTFIVNSGQKLGVGTSSPTGMIELNGSDTNTTITTGNSPALRIVNTATTNNNMGEISFTTNDTVGAGLRTASIMGINTSHTQNAMSGDFAFLTRNAGTFAERMRLKSNGYLGLGLTSPADLLTLSGGNLSITNGTASSTLGANFLVIASSTSAMSGKFYVDSSGNTSASGTLQQGTVLSCSLGLTTNAAGAITGCVASDQSIKQNIKPLKINTESIILGLKSVSYNWTKESGRDSQNHAGFVAQDVEKVFPQAVVSAGQGLKGVDGNAILSVVVKFLQDFYNKFTHSVQMLFAWNTDQDKKIEVLQKQVIELQREIRGK